ncbi:hypothetical protein CYLTODRAFT_120808 [Cylindrobasidium torrendii FP15055 ss-10]|uniref:Uncharacterized protein n=1 Tax=Cylindrobasidium torrendii FP15055 ss-10 TaxID=1314674 RepID=A0A0D7B0Z2_9AGAR|nr:hypothetical protein CYLTODRAFT_120808 [Cylindrobasidium torrendii FP15055 ss-10]
METPHAEECISFTHQAVQPEAVTLVSNTTWRLCVVAHQVLSGMDHGELDRRLQEPWNSLTLQPSVARAMRVSKFAFRPQDQVLKAILQLYRYNLSRALDARVRLDQSPVVHIPLKCTVELNRKSHHSPLYTRHPSTGATTRHTYPYDALPRFAPLGDAGLLSMATQAFLAMSYSEDSLFPELEDFWEADEVDEHVRLFKQPPPATTLPAPFLLEEVRAIRSMRKRKQAEDSSHLSKRIRRAAPSQHPKRSSQMAAPSKASVVARSSSPKIPGSFKPFHLLLPQNASASTRNPGIAHRLNARKGRRVWGQVLRASFTQGRPRPRECRKRRQSCVLAVCDESFSRSHTQTCPLTRIAPSSSWFSRSRRRDPSGLTSCSACRPRGQPTSRTGALRVCMPCPTYLYYVRRDWPVDWSLGCIVHYTQNPRKKRTCYEN